MLGLAVCLMMFTSSTAEFVMFADYGTGKIYQISLDSVDVKPTAIPFDENTKMLSPVALDYDWVEDRVYWTDEILQIICRAFRNGTGFEVLINDFGAADGLTIDPAGRQLYWTSTTNNTVETSKLDGSFRRTLVRWNLDRPRDIIVDPIDGYMYWTDWGKFPRIERAYMNGENRMDLVNHTLYWPNGLTIDHVYNKLYWVDAHEDNIEAMDLDTLERKVILNQKIILFGFLFGLTTEVNHPYGLTSLNDHLYWTDWNTDSVYRGDVNTAANIRVMATNLGKPMDIHAYSSIPKQQKRLHYTFSFPQRGSNFTCISSLSCPVINAPPSCPPGYSHVRENSKCGLNCRDIVGYTWRCPCNDWMSCAVKERYLWGCAAGFHSSFRVRECVQDVKAGRCPYGGGKGTSCVSDSDCPSNDKCCDSKCATPATIAAHPCQTNNGGCDQLCFGIPGGHKCGCKNGYYYNETQSRCISSTRPLIKPPTPPPRPCKPHPAPENGSVTCETVDGQVPEYKECNFSCDPGYGLAGFSFSKCIGGEWIDKAPTCQPIPQPPRMHCPNDTTFPTNQGKAYAIVNWKVPTATDKDGTSLPVQIYPSYYTPPANLSIGRHSIRVSATDKDGQYVQCSFFITVEDREPPSFGSTCLSNIQLYTDKDDSIRLPSFFKEPTATDNVKPPSVHTSGFPFDSFFPIGTTVVKYTATDDAGLTATCTFSVTVVNVCSGVTCTYGAKCLLDQTTKSSHLCACSTSCPQYYDPVCGSDGQDYNNECLLNVTVCTLRRTITVVKKGKCEKAKPRMHCPNDTTFPTNQGKAYAIVNWKVPTATDKDGTSLPVQIYPSYYTPPANLSIGRHSIRINATDKDGGYVQCSFYITVEDREPPSFGSTCPSNIQLYTDNDDSIRLPSSFKEPTATDNVKPPSVHSSGFPSDSFFPIGTTVVKYTATDDAGLTATCTFSVTVVNVCSGVTCNYGAKCLLDQTTKSSHLCACSTSCPKNYDPVCGSDGQDYNNECLLNVTVCTSRRTITVVKKGKCEKAKPRMHCPNDTTFPTNQGKAYAIVNWKIPTATDKDGTSLPVQIYPSYYRNLSIGSIHSIRVSATDKDGGYVQCSFYITVEDREPPSFGSTCPSNIQLYTDNDDSIRLPSSFKEPTATDNAKPPSVHSSGFPSDSFFPIGTTVVKYTATDDAGLTATCTFSVTVVNVCSGVTCNYGAKCLLDQTTKSSHLCACSTSCPKNYDPVCGSDGQDYNNECLLNVTVCTSRRTITVVKKGKCEKAKPRMHCPNDTTFPTNQGKAYAIVNWKIPTATDKDGTNLPVQIYPSYYTPPANLSIGRHSIRVSATDKDGEYVQCSFYITVEDREPPSFGSTCPSNIQLYTDNDDSIRLPSSFKEPTATDNVKPPSVHSSGFPSDSFFPIGTTVVKYTATDDAGLTATCTFSVTVVNVCSGVTCTYGAKCLLDQTTKSSHLCACSTSCPQYSDPVCGSDGQDYNNECLLNVTVCTSRRTITVVKRGICEKAKPRMHCPNDTTFPTNQGKAYAIVNWKVPTATDKDGTSLPVQIYPSYYTPPANLSIGRHSIRVSATDKDGEYVQCSFYITVEDREPPSFGSTCPSNIQLYTDKDDSIRLPSSFKEPTATDNVKPPSVHSSGFPSDSFFPIGTTVVKYTATDDAGLTATCTFSVTVVNVCSGVTCNYGAKCLLDQTTKSSHLCACSTSCPKNYDPVCGSDGQDYNNECLLNVTVCTSRRTITVVKKGKCEKDNDDSIRLPSSFKEPTATDNAKPPSVHSSGFPSDSFFPIGTTVVKYTATDDAGLTATCTFSVTVVSNTSCPKNYDPVCGSDGQDYNNECLLNVTVCTSRRTITVVKKGKCEKAKPRMHCPNDTTFPTNQGKAYAIVNWKFPRQQTRMGQVSLFKSTKLLHPPANLIEDREPPSFGSTCPSNIQLYTDKDDSIRLPSSFKEPTATDNIKPPSVHSSGFPFDSFFPIGTTVVKYTATDDAGLTATCTFSVTVVNVCSGVTCTYGAKCLLDQTTKSSHLCACSTSCPQYYDPVCGSDGQDYNNECLLNVTVCTSKRIITVVKEGKCEKGESCDKKKCTHGAICRVRNEKAECSCDLSCSDTLDPVCGSDGKNYENKCKMNETACNEKNIITMLKRGKCGCDDLNLSSESFTRSSTMQCQDKDNSVQCEVKCKSGYNAVFNDFLKLQCYEKQWIRGNNAGTYVTLADVNNPPTCYKSTIKGVQSPYCPDGSMALSLGKDICVKCPRGSYYDKSKVNGKCEPCPVTEYQDSAGQTSCKKCGSTKTSTTTGAENCYFDYGNSVVTMEFGVKLSEVSKDKIRSIIAKALTKVCKTVSCSYEQTTKRRKKRESEAYEFKAEHVIVVNMKEKDQKTEVEFLLLDPKPGSHLPEAFTTQNLKTLTKEIPEKDLVYPVSDNEASTQENSTSKTPIIAGSIGAFIAVIFLVFSMWMYRRHKNKSRIPPGQFDQGRTPISRSPEQHVSDHIYETPHDFQMNILQPGQENLSGLYGRNQVISSPFYESSPVHQPTSENASCHVYELPDTDLDDGLYVSKDAVVNLNTQKQVVGVTPKTVGNWNRRSRPNDYQIPEIHSFQRTPDPRYLLSFDQPPPNSHYVVSNETPPFVLPNAPRRSNRGPPVDHQGRFVYQRVGDATRGQTET
ncbi:uncharacterized protein LOC114533678 [Dendronephthya gigantea]|uniref:uncharacterized protein LOC114533678 n=1 Tax=Dendronephthya gigantea TaxID=151771 RepID=UPI0010690E77|nr:uncharacterized protein LOC114533678 [Dendronephthya gigantea]